MSKRKPIDRVRDALSSTGDVLEWADEDSIDNVEAELEDLRHALVEHLKTDELDPSELGALLAQLAEELGMSKDLPHIKDHANDLSALVQQVSYSTFTGETDGIEEAARDLAEDLDALYNELDDGGDSKDGGADG